LLSASMYAAAEAPGGPGCGWGNMIFEGKSGMPSHLLASLVNGTSGNATFGMTSGTNGCDTNGSLTYNGSSLLGMEGVLEEVAHDVAMGDGEALDALTVSMGVVSEDREHFKSTLHNNFASIFTSEDVTAEEVQQNINAVLKSDNSLSKYSV